jgi:hypothetical protein
MGFIDRSWDEMNYNCTTTTAACQVDRLLKRYDRPPFDREAAEAALDLFGRGHAVFSDTARQRVECADESRSSGLILVRERND